MYVPKHFSVDERAALDAVIRDHPFGILVGALDGAPFATHLPFMLEDDRLVAHFARGNPHCKAIDGKTEMLALFSGPHGYVSPRWYATGPAVPTWNYQAVHVYGTPRTIDEPQRVRALLDRLVAAYEGDGWTLASQDGDFLARMMRGIVAFEMPVARIEGKFKLSQNRPEGDRRNVAEMLARSERAEERALAEAMRRAEAPE